MLISPSTKVRITGPFAERSKGLIEYGDPVGAEGFLSTAPDPNGGNFFEGQKEYSVTIEKGPQGLVGYAPYFPPSSVEPLTK